MADRPSPRIPKKHLEVLQKSGLINPDVTLEQVINAAAELDALVTESENSVPTLIGPFYVYHSIEAIDELTSPRQKS